MAAILIVEDNPLILQLLEQMLEGEYELTTASNGELGVAAARERRPDLILMDLMMPVMDGWTAIQELRAQWSTCRIPIVAISAVSAKDDVARARDAGADAHVQKPIDEDVLRRAIERLI